jgi:hypothetical protein
LSVSVNPTPKPPVTNPPVTNPPVTNPPVTNPPVTNPPPPPVNTETLTVVKNTSCQADAQTCQQNPIQPSNFTIVIDGNNPSQNNFPGSSGTGTNVELESGQYNVTEQGLDVVTPEICTNMGYEAGSTLRDNLFICTNFSEECEGNITIGTPQTCTIQNVLVQTPVNTETLTVVKNTSCQADTATCEQNPIHPSNFTISIQGNNPSQNNFPGLSTGTDVELEAGPYNVTELELDPVKPAICSTMGFEAGSTLDEDLFICTDFSDECDGDIAIGNPQTCTIENVLMKLNFLDLAVANDNSDNVSILLGNGNGTFVPPAVNFGAGDGPQSVAVGDFNNDTILDLAVANFGSANVSILLGNGDGTFVTPAVNFGAGEGPTSIATGNFN